MKIFKFLVPKMDKCPKCGEAMQVCGNILLRGKKVEVLRCPKCNLRKLNL